MPHPLFIILHIVGDRYIPRAYYQAPGIYPQDLSIDDRVRVGSICMAVVLHCAHVFAGWGLYDLYDLCDLYDTALARCTPFNTGKYTINSTPFN